MCRTETIVELVDLCDLGEGFSPSANQGEKDGAIFMRATIARCQSDGTIELAIGSLPIPVKKGTQRAEGVVGFADAVVQLQCFGQCILGRPVGQIFLQSSCIRQEDVSVCESSVSKSEARIFLDRIFVVAFGLPK